MLVFGHTYLLLKYLQELIFLKFMSIYEILLELKCLSFKSLNIYQNLLAVDRTVDQTRGRSTDRSTDVHKKHAQRPVDRAVDRLKLPISRVTPADRQAVPGRP